MRADVAAAVKALQDAVAAGRPYEDETAELVRVLAAAAEERRAGVAVHEAAARAAAGETVTDEDGFLWVPNTPLPRPRRRWHRNTP